MLYNIAYKDSSEVFMFPSFCQAGCSFFNADVLYHLILVLKDFDHFLGKRFNRMFSQKFCIFFTMITKQDVAQIRSMKTHLKWFVLFNFLVLIFHHIFSVTQILYFCQTSVIRHPFADNVHETSASLISRCVTWGEEPGAMAGALSRTKHLEQGRHCSPCSLLLGSMSSGYLLTRRTRTPLEGNPAHSLHFIPLL